MPRTILTLTTTVFMTGLISGPLAAGEKNMMHCFAFTVEEKASQADWNAFYKANDAMPSKMKGIVKRVWFGKLRTTLTTYAIPDAAARKRIVAGESNVSTVVDHRPRQWGMCIELNGLNSLQGYADHPYHKEWEKVYFKVRVAGTTTYDILGQ